MSDERRARRSLVLLSGGIDSAVCALIAREESDHLHFVTFDYQQRNARELESARSIHRHLAPEAPHDVVRLDLSPLARARRSGLLAGTESVREPEYRYYVPGRNLIFLAHAAALAEVEGLDTIYFGSNLQDARRSDGYGFPDSGDEFLRRAEEALNLGLKYAERVAVRAPLLGINKFEAILQGHDLGLDFGLTWSCYGAGPQACGTCSACIARLINFHWAGLADPVEYGAPQGRLLADVFGA
jgi:7-cyano-7-deazaguanine synthase